MTEWLESLVPWGTRVVAWVQAHSSPGLDRASALVSALGYRELYLVLLPLVYWCVNRRVGIGLGYLSMLSAWANGFLKYTFLIPRPSGPGIEMKGLRVEQSPSFPSGHAQNAAANWGYLAVRLRPRGLRAFAAAAILAIGLSRIVLGVHFPQDVLGGWLIGLVLLASFAALEGHVAGWLAEQRRIAHVTLAVGLPVLLMLAFPANAQGRYPAEDAITAAAALAGLGVGVMMERALVRFEVGGPWWKRLLRFLLGLVIVAALWAGPEALLPEALASGLEAAARCARYALLGWAVAFACPWLFVRLHLASQEAAR